jgi:DNA-binding transcriptional ArsR family regulator
MRILRELTAQGEQPCSCVTETLDITKSTATHHWRVLRDAGVISQRPVGRNVLTAVRCDDLNARFPGLLDSILAC